MHQEKTTTTFTCQYQFIGTVERPGSRLTWSWAARPRLEPQKRSVCLSLMVPLCRSNLKDHRCPFWLIWSKNGLPGGSINYQGHLFPKTDTYVKDIHRFAGFP